MKGRGLVVLQFLAIGTLVKVAVANGVSGVGLILIVSGMIIGIRAIVDMRKSRFSVFPEPHAGARLLTTGVYSRVRHPMYSAVLIFCLGLLSNSSNWWTVLVWFFLLLVLVLKIRIEEQMLKEKFQDYEIYCVKVKRLIPFVW